MEVATAKERESLLSGQVDACLEIPAPLVLMLDRLLISKRREEVCRIMFLSQYLISTLTSR